MIRSHSHVAGFGFLRLHVGDFLGFRINMVNLGIKPLGIQAAEGHGDGSHRLDLLLAVPQGNVQQEAPAGFGLFFSQKCISHRPAFLVHLFGHCQGDFLGSTGQGLLGAGNGHGDAGF